MNKLGRHAEAQLETMCNALYNARSEAGPKQEVGCHQAPIGIFGMGAIAELLVEF